MNSTTTVPESTSATPPVSKSSRSRQPGSANGQTMLLHVNLPARLVTAVRGLAAEERRTITSQVALLLEESPNLLKYMGLK